MRKIESIIGAIVTLSKSSFDTRPRAIQLSQFDIFTATHDATTLPDFEFNEGDIVYCVPNLDGRLEITDNFTDAKFVARIVEKTILNDNNAFTLIVSKTIHEPDYDIEHENQQIKNYLNGKYQKWDWDFKFN